MGFATFLIPPWCQCAHDKLTSADPTEPGFLQGWEWEQEDFGKGFIAFLPPRFEMGEL